MNMSLRSYDRYDSPFGRPVVAKSCYLLCFTFIPSYMVMYHFSLRCMLFGSMKDGVVGVDMVILFCAAACAQALDFQRSGRPSVFGFIPRSSLVKFAPQS